MTVLRKRLLLAVAVVVFAVGLGRLPAFAQSHEPLRLSQAVKIALENHPAMRASAAEVDAARARYEQVRAVFFPRLWLEESFTRGNNPVYVFGTLLTQNRFTARNFELSSLNRPAPLDNFQTRFNVSFRLFDSWRTELTSKQAKLATRLADVGGL